MLLRKLVFIYRIIVCSWLLASASLALAGEYSVSGVQEFVREVGKPVEQTVSFNAPSAGGGYLLRVFNGKEISSGATHPVTAGVIKLNGNQEFSPSDFSEEAGYLETAIDLQLENVLSVKLAGKPGSGLRVEIVGMDNDLPEIIAIASPAPNSAGWHKDDVTVNFSCSDFTSGIEHCSEAVVVSAEGANQVISGAATDMAGNSTQAEIAISLDKTAPVIGVVQPVDGAEVDETAPEILLSFSDNFAIDTESLRFSINGSEVNCTVDGNGALCRAERALMPGQDVTLTATISDQAGNLASVESQFIIAEEDSGNSGDLPPNPEEIATPVDTTGTSSLKSITEFLYIGVNPIQTGMAPETIEERRASVIRGNVHDKENNPLPGVIITIKDHPEFGQTLSRENGGFDMAVNGGGYLVINYEKDGFLPAQRRVRAPWNDYVIAEDVVLIPLDSEVTTINLSDESLPFQVHQGSLQIDDDGARQATILFPLGTTATMTLPGGGVRNIDQLNVRATEYTVGENGYETMPGPLPPTSGYTYAVELSVDEAIASGATRVDFSQPLPVYVDNFLEFPAGTAVPAGWYSRDEATWIASDNGVVVEIVGINDGMVDLDIDGSGIAADATALSDLGITDAERYELARLYEVGKSIWRVPTSHFTPWDHNWPYGPPMDADRPELPEPETDDAEPEPDCEKGSIIECQGQVLRERISITGTPFSLNYRSDRVPGRKAYADIQLTEETVSPSLQQVVLEISIAGRKIEHNFIPQPNKSYRFVWDGLDVYGRRLAGRQPANIRIGYVYDALYYESGDFERAFARVGEGPITRSGGREVSARRTITFWQQSTEVLQAASTNSAGIGSWTLSPHHHYEISGHRVQKGDGTLLDVTALGSVIDTVAGSAIGGDLILGDGGPAVDASLRFQGGIASGPDGSFFITDEHLIRKIDVDGNISTVAGLLDSRSSVRGFSGDGGMAIGATMNEPFGLDYCDDGTLYVADTGNDRVRRIDRLGLISTVAGSEISNTFAGDGGLATEAGLNSPFDVVCDNQGGFYIADARNHRVRRVDANGVIYTVAGNGIRGFSGDGGPATEASLSAPQGIDVDPEGNLYIVDSGNRRVRRVGVDGRISTIAGNGGYKNLGDGGLAIEAGFDSPVGIAYGTDGGIYVSDWDEGGVRRIGQDGVVITVAGNKSPYWSFGGDGGPATQADMTAVTGVAIGPEGSLYLVDTYNNRIRKVTNPDSLALKEHFISSSDGSQLFHFDKFGKHIETRDSVSGAIIYSFNYTEGGLLQSIKDGSNNETIIERSSDGVPLAIVAPDGQRTSLNRDAEGFLASVTNPAGESYTMTYAQGGLLARFSDPNLHASSMSYDDLGYLLTDINAEGGGWVLEKENLSPGYEYRMTSAEGRTTRYQVVPQSVGGRMRTNIYPDDTLSTTIFGNGGDVYSVSPDGTETYRKNGPDPRFGMDAPVPASIAVTTPGGLEMTVTTTRTMELADEKDVLSHTALGQTSSVNGRITTARYDTGTRTWLSTSPEGRQNTTVLDEKGRPVIRHSGGLAALNFDYDSRGRLVESSTGGGLDQRKITYSYGSDGFLETITDSLQRTFSFDYDLAGRLTRQTYHDGRSVGFQYDSTGNLTTIIPPGSEAHIFNYTDVNLEEGYTPPDLNGVETVTSYQYNKDKQLTLIERPDGRHISYSYDDGGRLATRSIARGNYSHAYDADTGQLKIITAADGNTLSYTYDGFLPLSETWAGQIAGSVSWAYDNNFWQTEQCINGENCISFDYDQDGLLTQAGALSQTRYAQSGLLETLKLGNTATNYEYNSFGELLNAETEVAGSSMAGFGYQRDILGRIGKKTETLNGLTVNEGYVYDAAGRLKSVTRDGETSSWQYDSNGNRTHENGQLIATYDEQDRLITYRGASYSYTANGELKSKTENGATTSYSYDEFGNLVSASLPGDVQIEYLIDGRDRRIGKKVNGQLVQGFLYGDQLNPVAELDGSGNIVGRFVYGEKGNVPAYLIKGGVTYRIISDHLGSPRIILNANTGEVVQRMDYDAWGSIIVDTNPGFQPFGFAGGIYDQQTKLIRFGSRDYAADVGRWTAKDPIGFLGGSLGLYSYVNSDPVNNIDVDGLKPSTSRAPGNPFSRVNRQNQKLQSQKQSYRDRLKNLERNASEKKRFLDDAISELERRMHPIFPMKCVKRECPWDNLNPQSCEMPTQKLSPLRNQENGCKCVKEEADWSGPLGSSDFVVVR